MNTINTNLPKKASSNRDLIFWILNIIIFGAGLVANYYFYEIPFALRLLAWLFIFVIILTLIWQTVAGHKIWRFLKEARTEMYKVVWPNRKDTIQTTIAVVSMVVLVSLILWSIDSLLLWLVTSLTGRV